MWCYATDMQPQHHAPSVALQLSGIARILADEIDLTEMVQGATVDFQDGQGPQAKTGVDTLIHRLSKRVDELAIETVIRVIVEFMNFQRGHQESID